jgi:hypothetical protein
MTTTATTTTTSELPDDLQREVWKWYVPQLRKRMMHRALLQVMEAYKQCVDEVSPFNTDECGLGDAQIGEDVVSLGLGHRDLVHGLVAIEFDPPRKVQLEASLQEFINWSGGVDDD